MQNFIPPDETSITFSAYGYMGTEVMTLNLETGAITNMSNADNQYDEPEGISPDGKYLSYVDWETGDLAIYEIATGKKSRLTNKGSWDDSDEFAESAKWSADSKQIAYSWYNKQERYDLRLIGVDGEDSRVLVLEVHERTQERGARGRVHDLSPKGDLGHPLLSPQGGRCQGESHEESDCDASLHDAELLTFAQSSTQPLQGRS